MWDLWISAMVYETYSILIYYQHMHTLFYDRRRLCDRSSFMTEVTFHCLIFVYWRGIIALHVSLSQQCYMLICQCLEEQWQNCLKLDPDASLWYASSIFAMLQHLGNVAAANAYCSIQQAYFGFFLVNLKLREMSIHIVKAGFASLKSYTERKYSRHTYATFLEIHMSRASNLCCQRVVDKKILRLLQFSDPSKNAYNVSCMRCREDVVYSPHIWQAN